VTGDVVEVWLIRTDLPDRVLADLLALLDDGERERAGALVYPASRRRFIASHGTFRVILGRRLGVPPASLRWHVGPHGKPELAGPGPQVSFSHSGDIAAMAAAPRRRVGVDVQELLSDLDVTRMAARFYPWQEAQFVASAAGPATQVARFTWLWARKEACVKVAGGRLLPGLEQVIPRSGLVARQCGTPGGPCLVRDVRAPRGYRAAVAAEGTHGYDIIRRRARLLHDVYMTLHDGAAMLASVSSVLLRESAVTCVTGTPRAGALIRSLSAALTIPYHPFSVMTASHARAFFGPRG
jgi:4'-phosphopantetheinyl transferase